MTESFPRQHARTRGFTLGAPRSFAVADDGRRVAFLRSMTGDDPVNRLWVLDTATGAEQLVADPVGLLADPGDENLPPAERARRERARESGGGIVAYAGDPGLTKIAFTLDGRVFLAEVGDGSVHALPTEPGAFDPRPSPDGQRVAYVSGAGLRVVDAGADGQHQEAADANGLDRRVIDEPGDTVSWGSAEFIAAEEMGRSRGFWWSPDSQRLLVARVDTAPVPTWYIASPADPAGAPTPMAYPAAGTTNADVSLAIAGLDGSRIDVAWDRDAYEYLARAAWTPRPNPVIAVQSRNQQTVVILEVDPDTGTTTELARQTDSHWVELVPGTPAWMGERLVTAEDRGSARRLVIDGTEATPDTLQVRSVVAAGEHGVVFTASDDPTEVHVWQLEAEGTLERLTDHPGIHSAAASGETTVIARAAGTDREAAVEVVTPAKRITIASDASTPSLSPSPRFAVSGSRELRSAVLYPTADNATSGQPLPVLLDPYGGPHAQRVLKARSPFLVSQWFADQGFAVVITDGRGTPAPRPGLGASGSRRLGPSGARRPDRRSQRAGRAPPPPRPQPGGRAGLVVRRLPGRARRVSPPRPVPRRHRRGPGHRLAALRHPLHRALPGPPRPQPRGLHPHQPPRTGRRTHPSLAADLRLGRRQRVRGPHPPIFPKPCSKPAAPTKCSPCPASPT